MHNTPIIFAINFRIDDSFVIFTIFIMRELTGEFSRITGAQRLVIR